MQSALTLDSKKASLRWKLLNDLFAALLIDNHGPLQEAWETMAACPPKRRAVLQTQLAAMPLTEAEAMALVRDVWTNPDERVRVVEQNRVIAQWSRFAREKYDMVLAEARKCLEHRDAALSIDRNRAR
jgi:hypothetical protein